MSRPTYHRLFMAAMMLFFGSSGFAQTDMRVRPRQLPGWDSGAREGRCAIRVWVDNRAELRMRGDGIFVTTLEGARAYDEGSECSQPIPYNSILNFQVRQTAGRGQVNLAQEPNRLNNYTAMVLIEDRQGGGDSYNLEVSWRSNDGAVNSPAAFYDDVRACQDMVRRNFLSRNGRGAYIDFDGFPGRQAQIQGRAKGQPWWNRGQNRNQEIIQGRGSARSYSESRDLTYSCISNTRQGRVISGNYQLSAGSNVRSNQRVILR